MNPVDFSLDVDRSYMELSCKGISSILVKDSTKNSSDGERFLRPPPRFVEVVR